MDTSQLANIAESHIASELQLQNILVAKPHFDILGTDLLAFMEMKDGIKFCRIQSKGRTLVNSKSNVTIDKNYVTGAFVLFLYLVLENNRKELYMFIQSDIEKWSINNKNQYQLSLSPSNVRSKLEFYKYDASKAKLIETIINQAEISGEFKRLIYGKVEATLAPVVGAAIGTIRNRENDKNA